MTAAILEAPASQPTPRAAASAPLAWLRERGMGASILVAAISTAFGVVLISATAYIGAMLRADPYIGSSGTLGFVLSFLTVLLVGVAVYVASIVTANTFATVVAGRTRRIALLRLIGASARSQRSEIARQGLVVGVIGAFLGLVGGTALAAGGVWLAGRMLGLDDVPFDLVRADLLIPAVIVALTTWAAAWAGSRRVLTVTPLQALGGSVEVSHEAVARRSGRNVAALVLFIVGGALLALGVLGGLVSPLGVVVAFVGGILSFTGLALGATLVMPPVLRLVGRLFGRSATARLAAENALRYPERSSRMAIGVVMGVTLVTMFAVAIESTKAVMTAAAGGELPTELGDDPRLVRGDHDGPRRRLGGDRRRRTRQPPDDRRGAAPPRARPAARARRLERAGAAHGAARGRAHHDRRDGDRAGARRRVRLGGRAVAARIDPDQPRRPVVGTFVWPAVPLWPVVAIVVATAVLTLVAAVVPTRLATASRRWRRSPSSRGLTRSAAVRHR